MTREDAVQYLKDLGLKAGPRDWSMGKTIYILMGEPFDGEMEAYPGALYLVPLENDQWAIDDGGRFVEIWPSLKEVTDRAADYAAWWVDGLEARKAALGYYIKLNRTKTRDM